MTAPPRPPPRRSTGRRKRHAVLLAAALAAVTVADPPAAAADFAALRAAADALAAREKPGFRLLMARVTASTTGGTTQVHSGEFHYFGPVDKLAYRVPGVTTRIGDMPMFRVRAKSSDTRPLTRSAGFSYALPLDEGAWTMTPVPETIVGPVEALRRLNRRITGDPYRTPRDDRPGRDLFDVALVQIGDARSARSRADFRWAGLSAAFGFRRQQAEFFARTGPLGRWIWWTVIEQDRPDPASDPRRAGTPRRVLEYIYIDAITGKSESHCHGANQQPVPC